jgi:hypothetical protein
MLPFLWEEKAASSRGRVVRFGRFLEGQREHLQWEEEWDEDWLKGLEMHVEVFDRMDGFQMLSMRGPVTLEGDENTLVGMVFRGGCPQMQQSSAAFSAASRDPLGRFGSLREYMERGHEEEYPCCLCIRLTLRDMRTGKMAVVLEVNKGRAYYFHDDAVDNERYIFEGPQRYPNAIGRLLDLKDSYLYISPVVGQGEAVSMQDRLYRVQPHNRDLAFLSHGAAGLKLEQFKWALQAIMT